MTPEQAKKILDNMYGDWRTEEEREALSIAITLMGEIEPYIKPCSHVLAGEPCDYYDRKSNYTCDFSDLCASCKHNPEIGADEPVDVLRDEIFDDIYNHLLENK